MEQVNCTDIKDLPPNIENKKSKERKIIVEYGTKNLDDLTPDIISFFADVIVQELKKLREN